MVKKTRKLPLRVCVGCKEKKNKKELVRIVKTPEGTIEVDFAGKKAGRGAYICPQEKCLDIAIKKKSLEKSLKQSLTQIILEELKESLSNE